MNYSPHEPFIYYYKCTNNMHKKQDKAPFYIRLIKLYKNREELLTFHCLGH